MPAFRVVVTDQVFPDVDIERAAIEALGGELLVATGDIEDVLALATDADGLLNTYLPLDAAALDRLPKCRVIARYGIGVDNIDLHKARARGIDVTNVPDYCVEEVATHTMALLLALIRRLPAGDSLVRGGSWGVAALGPIHRLSSMTVGLIGYGRIGRLVSGALSSLGATVVVHDPYRQPGDDGVRTLQLEELFSTSDVVSIHCPLTEATHGLVNAKTLGLMRPGSFLINTSRGPIVETTAVAAALRDGQLGGAALDVFDREPPAIRDLANVPNLLVTPHAAFYSVEAVQESQRKAVSQVLKSLNRQPLDYLVN